MRVLLLLFLVTSCYAAGSGPATGRHTEVYDAWVAGTFTDTLFVPDTFLEKHRCTRLDGGRAQYVRLLDQEGIPCTGSWCIDGKFKCRQGDSQACYNMEHIIDTNGVPILTSYDRNIVGNVVMAYGKWNQQIGNFNWEDVELEKRAVYGNMLVDRALLNIQYCQLAGQEVAEEAENQEEEEVGEEVGEGGPDLSTKLGYIFGSIVLVGCMVCIGLVIKYGKWVTPEAAPVPISESDSELEPDSV